MNIRRLFPVSLICAGMVVVSAQAQDPRACCLPDGSCADISALMCQDQGGTPGGGGTSCELFICGCPDQPLGCTAACCFDDGRCFDEAPQQCVNLGGNAQAEGSSCSELVCTCTLPEEECAARACCFEDGTCMNLPSEQCVNRGGAPGGAQTSCDAFICGCPDLPLGCTAACCFPEERCQQPVGGFCCFDEPVSLCEPNGGIFRGRGTSCADVDPCADGPSCGDGIIDPDEECDDGDLNSDTDPDACRTDCTLPFCGDGVIDSGEECDDGDANSDTEPGACRTDCTLPDDCVTDADCDNGDACTTDVCDPTTGTCTNEPIVCDDGDACTTDECVEGQCVNTPTGCDDGDACTIDECIDGACVHTPVVCDDGDPCTTDECVDGECVFTPVVCDDGDECTMDECIDGECVFTPIDPPPPGCVDFAGCTPGFWKQRHHLEYWVGYSPEDPYEDVFGVEAVYLADKTLLQAAGMGGGGEIALGRHAVAGLLNSTNPEVEYFYTTDEVIALVQEAYETGDFEFAKDELEYQNELGCTVDKSKDNDEPGFRGGWGRGR